jgi:hypothetical protein
MRPMAYRGVQLRKIYQGDAPLGHNLLYNRNTLAGDGYG